MGQSASRAVKRPSGIVVTLDALGTLYRFKRPVAVQYSEIARRNGLSVEADRISKAFKMTYKAHVSEYPNYGLGKLDSAEVWWTDLVHKVFSQATPDSIPEDLGKQLYHHFTSAEAYELHDDVAPFLQSMHNLRNQFSDPKQPAILTGIITNSDLRVRNILESLSLNVGAVKVPTRDEIRESAALSAESGTFNTPWSKFYDPKRDFDFLVTGYETGAEKPDPEIWRHAEFEASLVAVSKAEQGMKLPEGRFKGAFAVLTNAIGNIGRTDNMRWIHIGDEYGKDYEGAKAVGKEALLLDRDSAMNVEADKVTSLEEAAVVVNLMAQELLNRRED